LPVIVLMACAAAGRFDAGPRDSRAKTVPGVCE
jgi:hypothetical protein